MRAIFKHKIPAYSILIITAAFLLVAYLIYENKTIGSPSGSLNNAQPQTGTSYCNFNVERLHGFNYISPLLYVETQCPSQNYDGLKQKIASFIEEQKQSGAIEGASFYFRDPIKTEW